MNKLRLGEIVTLKIDCMGNPAGTKGIVFQDYDLGVQIIFRNGENCGFGQVDDNKGKSEIDIFINKQRKIDKLIKNYIFTNVMILSRDYESGVFDKSLGVDS